LAKNEKKTLLMLNENNFSYDDSIVILRTFLNKSKKILDLALEYEKNNNIDLTISKARPPIFWKNKEITKQQIYKWKPSSIKKLIYQINTMELLVKKNFNNSTNFITDFLLEQSSESINN
jgi:DNA polymerase-3 subunit delta